MRRTDTVMHNTLLFAGPATKAVNFLLALAVRKRLCKSELCGQYSWGEYIIKGFRAYA